MSQNKFFKYVRNYFVRLPLSHYIPHFLPIMYGGIFIIAIFQLCISGVKNHYTLDVILIEAAIVLPISMILVPLILWVINAWWILFDAFRQALSEFIHGIKGDNIAKNPGEEEFLCSLDIGNQPFFSKNSETSWFKENKIIIIEISEDIDDQTGEPLALMEPKQIYLPEGKNIEKEMLNSRKVDMLYQGVMKYISEVLKDYLTGDRMETYVNNIFDLRESTNPESCARNLAVVSENEHLYNMSNPRKRMYMYDIYSLIANLRPLTKGEGVTNGTLYLAYRQMFPGVFARVKEDSFAQSLSKSERYDSENHIIPNEVIPRLYQRTQNATIEYFLSLAQTPES